MGLLPGGVVTATWPAPANQVHLGPYLLDQNCRWWVVHGSLILGEQGLSVLQVSRVCRAGWPAKGSRGPGAPGVATEQTE